MSYHHQHQCHWFFIKPAPTHGIAFLLLFCHADHSYAFSPTAAPLWCHLYFLSMPSVHSLTLPSKSTFLPLHVSSDVLGCSVPVPPPRTKCLTWACAGLQLKQWIEISVELLPCHWRFCLVGNVWWKLTSESSYHFLSSNPFSSMWVLVDVLDLFHNPFLHF